MGAPSTIESTRPSPSVFGPPFVLKRALRLREPVEGRAKFKGELRDAGADALTLSADGKEWNIPYETIVRGNLIDER